MTVGDASIDYDVNGEGPPLLLVAGLGFGRWSWFKQIPALSESFRIISYDVRNIGHLDPENGAYTVSNLARHAAALLDHLDVERAHVLGSSLGGFVAQELALQRRELVDHLVLICTSYGGSKSKSMSPDVFRKMLGWGSVNRADAVRRGLETAVSPAYTSTHPNEFERLVALRIADSPHLADYVKQMMAGAKFDSSGQVDEISALTLVLHGAEDRVVPVSNAVSLTRELPDAKLRIYERAGHLVFIERAEEVNEAILDFLPSGRLFTPAETETPLARLWTKLLRMAS